MNVSGGEPGAVIFWERSSEEMLIFNAAFLWLDGWVLLMTLSGRSTSQPSAAIQGFQMSQDTHGSQENQRFWKFCLKYWTFREIPVASVHDHAGNSWEKSDFRVGWCLSHAELVSKDFESNEGLHSLKATGNCGPHFHLENLLLIDSIFVLLAVGRVFAQPKTVCTDWNPLLTKSEWQNLLGLLYVSWGRWGKKNHKGKGRHRINRNQKDHGKKLSLSQHLNGLYSFIKRLSAGL